MLLDALNISNNSLVELPREIINSCKAETVVTASVANGFTTTVANHLKQDTRNFLLAILFAADVIRTEGLTKLVIMSLE
jgi:hypothetical protein